MWFMVLIYVLQIHMVTLFTLQHIRYVIAATSNTPDMYTQHQRLEYVYKYWYHGLCGL
jgi:hypothetical protein